jgi:UDP-N-acetylglucosamine 2-epimerase
MKTIVTITGIRPDFIRMSAIFKKLDENFNHVLIHTGQHYDKMLSDVFFQELEIRKPNYNLEIGGPGKEHFHQTGELGVKVIELFRKEGINPDLILFLGDSNSVLVAPVLAKEGYKIGHIEAGMRSYDKRMLEEINRTCCDHVSDLLFVYHDGYAAQLKKENITDGVHVVGNTIVEVCKPIAEQLTQQLKKDNQIILDIHRPENFKYRHRMANILRYADRCHEMTGLPIYWLKFPRAEKLIEEYGLTIPKCIEVIDLMSYKKYLSMVYDSMFIISDSGTAQEEPALLDTPVIVPRDYTERPQSVANKCSYMINVNMEDSISQNESMMWLHKRDKMSIFWLGNGKTSTMVTDIIKEKA